MKYIIILLSGLELSDGVITQVFVGKGLAQESNPLMQPLVMAGDFLLFKIVGVLLSVLALWWLYKRFPLIAISTASSIVVFYGAVLAWNLSVLL